ncbi:MAG TPA: ABC transporter substrate-binding protein [Thermoleophilia bacterium]|nr:ABC transporter substrate-binding protein [Thermoleophilia bacterium]
MRRVPSLIVLLLLALVAATALGAVACGDEEEAGPEEGQTYSIGVTQIVSHPALDACVEGFKEALAEKGYEEGVNVTFDVQNAQGDMATATTIAQKFAGEGLDLVLSVATPTSQAMVKADSETPIVFSAVTDPIGAGLLTNGDAPEANVTGVSDMLPVEPHLELIKRVVPEAQTVGLLYNAGEANSVFLVDAEKAAAAEMGLATVEATASNSSEVKAAAESLVGRCDVISVLTDNTVVSGLESVVMVCQENGIPLVAGDTDSVKRGAATAYAFDYFDHGKQAGYMAAEILAGTAIADVPIQFAENLVLSVNEASAAKMGLTLPEDLVAEATEKF